MSFTLIKLFSWFKGNSVPIIVIASIAIAAIGGIQTWRANKWYKEHLRLEGKLEEQKTDQDRLYEEVKKERKSRNEAEAKEWEKRKELEARIQHAKKEGEKAKLALKREKQKTAKLPATELVIQINERIGDESSLTRTGLFLFTRIGVNRTLDRFKDGEFFLSEYERLANVIEDHDLEVASFNESLTQCEEAEAKNLKGWDDCRETLATAIADIAALDKAAKASIWKARAEGAIGGGLAVIILGKILGIF